VILNNTQTDCPALYTPNDPLSISMYLGMEAQH